MRGFTLTMENWCYKLAMILSIFTLLALFTQKALAGNLQCPIKKVKNIKRAGNDLSHNLRFL